MKKLNKYKITCALHVGTSKDPVLKLYYYITAHQCESMGHDMLNLGNGITISLPGTIKQVGLVEHHLQHEIRRC